jgi:UDP-glucose 4-epimerase
MRSKWSLTGGAGYIGSHIILPLGQNDRFLFSIDDLSSGFITRIQKNLINFQVSLLDAQGIKRDINHYEASGFIHLAAKKRVGESVERPDYYWQENVVGFQNLLDVMLEHNVKNLVLSSSASVYGQPEVASGTLITEETKCEPINPYGETKLEGERLARKFAEEHGFKVAALRYFNVAGAGRKDLGDRFAYNLIPIVFDAIDRGEQPIVFGDDYDTPDGSCIRDYVHVQDLADAHMAAIELVENSEPGFQAINIGTGIGASVFEVIDMVSEVTGKSIEPRIVDRRQGDPASLVADVNKAKEVLGWESKYDLRDIVASAWEAWRFDHDK